MHSESASSHLRYPFIDDAQCGEVEMSLLDQVRNLSRLRRREMRAAYVLILPAVIVYLVFVLIPAIQSLHISLFHWSGLSAEMEWAGLSNYISMFTEDAVFRRSMSNSIIATSVLAIVPTALGLGFAAIVGTLRGGGAYRSAVFFPYLISMVAVGLIWAWIYNPRVGVFDVILEAVGLGNLVHNWLGERGTALAFSLIPVIWRFTGFSIVIFYAAIQGIPVDLYEAAKVDGASAWQSFWRITLPLVRQAMIIVVVWMTVDALKLFDLIWVLTKGGPNHATEVLATWMYTKTFRHFKMGYGSAMGVVLFLMIFVFSIIYIRFSTREDREE